MEQIAQVVNTVAKGILARALALLSSLSPVPSNSKQTRLPSEEGVNSMVATPRRLAFPLGRRSGSGSFP